MLRAKRPRLNAIASSSASLELTWAITRLDRWSNVAPRFRVAELVQSERLDAGAALILESVTRRVTLPQAIAILAVPVASTKVASLPPATARYPQEPDVTGE